MTCAQKVVRELLPVLTVLLPVKSPGLSAGEVRKELDRKANDKSIRTALAILEREGRAISYQAHARNGQYSRLFRRVSDAEESDNYEDSREVYGDGYA